ncbi:hypothetical protein Cgig2_009196 [Carnegiea gigantea]|uniref:Uncharacterized protein n=1 Tax=Carnegiea gigantea TaxID=171969 RepID=A0A9Q1GPX5_9CARY|nr:hypothetical protein Cgig2_009196 [Carnegiea gigantea]
MNCGNGGIRRTFYGGNAPRWIFSDMEIQTPDVDAELIQKIPLSINWPEDKIIWHFYRTARSVLKDDDIWGEFVAVATHGMEANDRVNVQPSALATGWRVPDSGIMKLNFDAANRHDNDYGWGFVLSSKGDVLCGETMHGESFLGDEVKEARACRYAL